MDFFTKVKDEFVPVTIDKLFSKPSEWDGAFVLVRVGSEAQPASQDDLDEISAAIAECDVVKYVNNASFFITSDTIDVSTLKQEDFKKIERD